MLPQLQEEVERLLGRRVLCLRRCELLMKAMLARHELTGTVDTLEANLSGRVEAHAVKTRKVRNTQSSTDRLKSRNSDSGYRSAMRSSSAAKPWLRSRSKISSARGAASVARLLASRPTPAFHRVQAPSSSGQAPYPWQYDFCSKSPRSSSKQAPFDIDFRGHHFFVQHFYQSTDDQIHGGEQILVFVFRLPVRCGGSLFVKLEHLVL